MSSMSCSTPDEFREKRILCVWLGGSHDFAGDEDLTFMQRVANNRGAGAVRSPEFYLHWPHEFAVFHPDSAARLRRFFFLGGRLAVAAGTVRRRVRRGLSPRVRGDLREGGRRPAQRGVWNQQHAGFVAEDE